MHIYVAVSTIYIGFLIYKSCTRKPDLVDEDDLCHYFPIEHYVSKINLFRFFSEDINFNRLKTVYDNNLLSEMIKTVKDNQELYIEYKEWERFLSTEYFTFEDDKKISIEINDETFETNIATLNFIRWFISRDYFLYFDNIEDKKEQ
jgi:hypothetical protein